MPNTNFKGCAVIVTGASAGLGEALSRKLAGDGAKVVMVARHAERLNLAASRIRSEGGEVHALTFDIADIHSAHRIAGAAADLIGDIDLLVHNASTLGPLPLPLLLDTACEDLAQVIETNLIGPFRLTKIIAGSMLLRERGTVVHISSDAAVDAYARWGAYSISKAALDHMNRLFATEIPSVKFLSIDPGEMDTQMHADAIPDADRKSLAKPGQIANLITRILAHSETIPSGSRIVAPSWSAP